jgi:hypothetical protein
MPPAPNSSQDDDEGRHRQGEAGSGDPVLRYDSPTDYESWHGLRHDLKPSPGMGDHADQEQQVQRERPRGLQKIEPGFIGALAAREADEAS